MDDALRSCITCKWRQYSEEYAAQGSPNECHRFPPAVVGDDEGLLSTWPHVRDEDWCGEWVQA